MKLEKSILIEKYIFYCVEMEKAMEKNDYRTNNRYAKRFCKLTQKYEGEDYYIEALDELMENKNVNVSANAAVDSLRCNANIDKAVKILKEISENEKPGINKLGAEIALERWLSKGAEGLK